MQLANVKNSNMVKLSNKDFHKLKIYDDPNDKVKDLNCPKKETSTNF